MDLMDIAESEIRLTPNGFAWVFKGVDAATKHRTEIALYFDFSWVRTLGTDLYKMLNARDAETAAARRSLGDQRLH